MEAGHEAVDHPTGDNLDASKSSETRRIEKVGADGFHEERKVIGRYGGTRPARDDWLSGQRCLVSRGMTYDWNLRAGTLYARLYTPTREELVLCDVSRRSD